MPKALNRRDYPSSSCGHSPRFERDGRCEVCAQHQFLLELEAAKAPHGELGDTELGDELAED